MKLRDIARRFLAVVALFALLTVGVPALTESLAASESPACCNTAYCPVHHRQVRDIQKDRNNCDAQGRPRQTDCSVRACDTTPNQAVGTAPFVLVAPVAIFYEATMQAAVLSMFRFFPFT